MKNEGTTEKKWIWLWALVLMVGVAATVICLVDRYSDYMMDDSGALPLVPQADADAGFDDEDSGSGDADAVFVRIPKSGFEISDGGNVWTASTDVEIFNVSYEDNQCNVTVNGGNGEKVIAPGTTNAFVFKVKNTGETALDYEVDLEAFFTPKDTIIPIQAKISRYDGEWVAGDTSNFIDITNVEDIHDKGTLGAGRYTYYALEWVWPFEQGLDELDTSLGNASLRDDITFTLRVKTTAYMSTDPNADAGIRAPSTGDSAKTLTWILLAGCAIAAFILLLFWRRKEDDEKASEMEAEKLEQEE
ncbi:MAG: LPXTG cell wall anchor domain-containing protein [Firmicutes bacterium]|nr:LPXTG cell wall anchor domain-containing protein [Bacillota bacterium]